MVRETKEGLVFSAKIRPGSGKFSFFRKDGDIRLELKSPARGGKANAELIRKLRKMFRREVLILKGFKTRKKLVFVEGLKKEEFEGFLEG